MFTEKIDIIISIVVYNIVEIGTVSWFWTDLERQLLTKKLNDVIYFTD